MHTSELLFFHKYHLSRHTFDLRFNQKSSLGCDGFMTIWLVKTAKDSKKYNPKVSIYELDLDFYWCILYNKKNSMG